MNNSDRIIQKVNLTKLKDIPAQSKMLFIDVGLAIDAPNTSSWLINHRDAFVVGIEPSPVNIAVLKKGRLPNVSFPYLCLDDDAVILNNKVVDKIDKRLCVLEVAIDNVEEPTEADFYLTDERNTGCSSLLKPTHKLGLEVKEVLKTPVISLKHILDSLMPDRFSHVTFLKTDAQGKDLDVVKSCKEHLKNVLMVQMEVFTNGQYEGEQTLEDINKFMISNNFVLIGGNSYDKIYINEILAKNVTVPNISFIAT